MDTPISTMDNRSNRSITDDLDILQDLNSIVYREEDSSSSSPRSRSTSTAIVLDPTISSSMPPPSINLHNLEIESIVIAPSSVKTIEEDKHQHTVFILEIKLYHGLRWFVEKRYSDFRELHESLKRLEPSIKALSFPKRHLFRSHQTSVIEGRRIELQHYCNALLVIKPLMKSSIYPFLEVYAHMESYERKQLRRKKMVEIETLKRTLHVDVLEELVAAFTRLCVGQGNQYREYTAPTSTSSSMYKRISKHTFRRDVLGTFPDMPPNFASKFMRACTDNKPPSDITLDEFLRAMAIFLIGTIEDKISFVFHMCDHDHASKVSSTSLQNFIFSIHGRRFIQKPEVKLLLNSLFEGGRSRENKDSFIKKVLQMDTENILTLWMKRFVDVLMEPVDAALLEMQEEFNPKAQQEILASETSFSVDEITVMQKAFNQILSLSHDSRSGTEISLSRLSNMFHLGLSTTMLRRTFSLFGKRANGIDMDIFSFVCALDIASGRAEKNVEEIKVISNFEFCLFDIDSKKVLLRESLFHLLQYDLSNNGNIENHIAEFLESQKELPNRSTSTREILNEPHASTVSGSQVGLYVDHILNTFGSPISSSEENIGTKDTILCLTQEQFSQWEASISFHTAIVSLLRVSTFVELGLRPKTLSEERDIVSRCFTPYPSTPKYELVEDDEWFIIESGWYATWCAYTSVSILEKEDGSIFLDNHVIFNKRALFLSEEAKNSPSITSLEKACTTVDEHGDVLKPSYINNTILLPPPRSRSSSAANHVALSSINSIDGNFTYLKDTSLEQGKDFVIICARLWEALCAWYGK